MTLNLADLDPETVKKLGLSKPKKFTFLAEHERQYAIKVLNVISNLKQNDGLQSYKVMENVAVNPELESVAITSNVYWPATELAVVVVPVNQLGASGWLYVAEPTASVGTHTSGFDGIVVTTPASNSADCVACVKLKEVAATAKILKV